MKYNIVEVDDLINNLSDFRRACRNSEQVCGDIVQSLEKLKSTKSGDQRAQLVREVHELLRNLNWESIGSTFGGTYDHELEMLEEMVVTAIGEPNP